MKCPILACVTLLTVSLRAQPPGVARPSPWSAGLFTVFDSQPYKGAGTDLRVFPAASYRGKRLQWYGPVLRYVLVRNERFTFAPHLIVDFPAYEEDDAAIFAGMGDREFTLLGGFDAEYKVHPSLETGVSLERDLLGTHDGLLMSAFGRVPLGHPRAPLSGSVSAGLHYQDSNWTDYAVGVPEADARDGRPAYAPGDAWVPFAAGRILVRFAEKWAVLTVLRAEYLGGTWQDSPLVEDDIRLTGIFSLTRSF